MLSEALARTSVFLFPIQKQRCASFFAPQPHTLNPDPQPSLNLAHSTPNPEPKTLTPERSLSHWSSRNLQPRTQSRDLARILVCFGMLRSERGHVDRTRGRACVLGHFSSRFSCWLDVGSRTRSRRCITSCESFQTGNAAHGFASGLNCASLHRFVVLLSESVTGVLFSVKRNKNRDREGVDLLCLVGSAIYRSLVQ